MSLSNLKTPLQFSPVTGEKVNGFILNFSPVKGKHKGVTNNDMDYFEYLDNRFDRCDSFLPAQPHYNIFKGSHAYISFHQTGGRATIHCPFNITKGNKAI